jgi:hypothetical protein
MFPLDPPTEERGAPEARYANYCKVGHNAYEFLIDFGQLYTDHTIAVLHTRIVTNPGFAKDMLETLAASVDAYERQFGVIGQP